MDPFRFYGNGLPSLYAFCDTQFITCLLAQECVHCRGCLDKFLFALRRSQHLE